MGMITYLGRAHHALSRFRLIGVRLITQVPETQGGRVQQVRSLEVLHKRLEGNLELNKGSRVRTTKNYKLG